MWHSLSLGRVDIGDYHPMTPETDVPNKYAQFEHDTRTPKPTDPIELTVTYAKFDYANLQAVCNLFYGDVELAEYVLWEVDGALIDPEQRDEIEARIYPYVAMRDAQGLL